MKSSLIDFTFKKCRKEKRPALITFTVAGDNTKKFIKNIKLNFKIR